MDEAFPGPALMPSDAKRRARVAQVCSVLDSYGWHPMVITVFVQRVVVPMRGGKPDQGAIDAALPQAGRVLAAVEGLMDGGEFLIDGRSASPTCISRRSSTTSLERRTAGLRWPATPACPRGGSGWSGARASRGRVRAWGDRCPCRGAPGGLRADGRAPVTAALKAEPRSMRRRTGKVCAMSPRTALVACAFAICAVLAAAPAAAQHQPRRQLPRGEYLATIMDCGGCHTGGALGGAGGSPTLYPPGRLVGQVIG